MLHHAILHLEELGQALGRASEPRHELRRMLRGQVESIGAREMEEQQLETVTEGRVYSLELLRSAHSP